MIRVGDVLEANAKAITSQLEVQAQQQMDRLMRWETKLLDAGPECDSKLLADARRNIFFLRGAVHGIDLAIKLVNGHKVEE